MRGYPSEIFLVAAVIVVIAVSLAGCARNGLGGYELPKIFRSVP